MRGSLLGLAIAVAFASSCGTPDTPSESAPTRSDSTGGLRDGNYIANKVEPNVTWAAEKLTGEGHKGNLHVENAKFMVKDGQIAAGLVKFDMTQISVTDLTGESKENLENHLKSGDFFNVEVHPKAVLTVNRTASMDGDNATLNCTLSMNGKAVDYDIPVLISRTPVPGAEHIEGISLAGKIMLDRTKHDIKYQSGTFFDNLDWAIKDDVAVGFRIMGTPMDASSVKVPQNF
jgi:polyisoprenoid-binding protein YceI